MWDFGDGSQSFLQDPSHLYSSGTYTVSLVAISGNCRDTLKMIDLISIGDSLQTNFTFDNSSICEESQINFTDYTLNSPENWIWNFGDGNTSQLQNPSHIYDSSGTYDVSLTTFKNGGQCSSTSMVFAAIEVLSNPQVDILVDTSYSCSIPLDVQFNDNTNGSVYWNWVFSNGITSSFSNPQVCLLYTSPSPRDS